MTLAPESAGTAHGRARLTGRRVVVVGAGTRPSPDPEMTVGNGRAIAVLCAREGASVACVDVNENDGSPMTATICSNQTDFILKPGTLFVIHKK
jgi:NAD(P)-dependent dehydrogenase (short-subunit alcohol dehydrogenase family)